MTVLTVFQFRDERGSPLYVRSSAIMAVVKSESFVKGSKPEGDYCPGILLLEGGHSVLTDTPFEVIVKKWRQDGN